MVEEAGENHQPLATTGKLYHLQLQVECTLVCNLQSRVRTHAILVIGLYELLGNPCHPFPCLCLTLGFEHLILKINNKFMLIDMIEIHFEYTPFIYVNTLHYTIW